MVPGVAPSPTARLGHPGDVHSGLLKPSPSSHGSAMVRLGRRCLILTKKASKGNNPQSFFENMVNDIHDSFAFSLQKH